MAQVQDIPAIVGSNRSAGLGGKIAMLAWEECRVGGVIAAWTSAVGALLLAYLRANSGPGALRDTPEFMAPIIFGVPILIAMLLVLNPSNSGHLVGGFSDRVLRLPVSVRASVAVVLLSRMFFVVLSSEFIVLTSQTLFLDSPGIGLAGVFVMFYLVAQALDWLRAPIAGLSSILVLVCAVAATIAMGSGWGELWSGATNIWVHPIFVFGVPFVAALVYGMSVPAVHAARIGYRTGVPELWEWPSKASFLWPARHRPFASPMAAQIWYEFRFSAAWLPALMIGIWIMLYAGCWLVMDSRVPNEPRVSGFARAVLPFASLILAAAAQGMRTRTVRFRNASTNTDYSFLLPLSSAQLAAAYVTATGLAFVIALGIAIIGHFYGTPALAMVGSGLDVGAISLREAAWILLSRGMLVGLIAWPLMAVKTRIFAWAMSAAFSTGVLTIVLYVWTESKSASILEVLAVLLMLFFIGLTAGAYTRAWSRNLITARALSAWALAWTLAALLLAYTMWDFEPIRSFLSALATLIASLAFAALVPLPYVAIVFNIARQRHGAIHPQEVTQHRSRAVERYAGPARAFTRAVAAALVLFVAWLGWPARPAYHALWRSHGYPTTLAELDAWYEAVPDDENAARDYAAASERHGSLTADYYNAIERRKAATTRSNNLLIVGDAELKRGEPIPPEAVAATQAYWNEVTSQIAPALKEIALNGTRPGRYPIELENSYTLSLGHLAPLRALTRELYVDALHWAMIGDTESATESIGAIFAIADSLREEPVLISQLVRAAIYGILFSAAEDVLSRVEFTDDQLARLQQAFVNAAKTPSGLSPMERAFVGESLFYFDLIDGRDANVLGNPGFELTSELNVDFLRTPFYALLFPHAAERMIGAGFYASNLQEPDESLLDAMRSDLHQLLWREEDLYFIAPLASIYLPAVARAREAEWRRTTQFQIAQSALAVERYRLANGRLPEGLHQLVPHFMEHVPEDFYGNGEPLKYLQREDGEYVVYSVGFDGEDDFGNIVDDLSYWESDLAFTVSSASRGLTPQT